MTDNTASNPAPAPQDQPRSNRNPTASPRASGPSPTGPSQNWEVVNFPGQMAITDVQETAPAAASAPTSPPLHRTEELIQLIQDLNQCNDALLIRVSDLEESLERSQAALQAEVERNQIQGVVTSTRTPAPAQVAQLLSELEATNDGLRRATIHNETLQTELEASQQRVAQLERECTLLQQRFSEKNTALQQAEDSCRDLKARLHRQQRYTLQFKTALEKCLNMANDAQPPAAAAPTMVGLGTEDSQPVAMPKAQEIQPWSAPSVAATHQADALSNLIHSFKPTVAPAPSAPVVASTPTPTTSEPAAPDTWAKPAAEVPAPAPEAPAIVDPWIAPAAEAEPSPGFTEPSPWGAPLTAKSDPESVETAAPSQITTPPQTPEPVADFPEPFQTRPVVKPALAKAEPALAAPVSPQPAPPPPVTTPAAYPQRSQRKIASLAAVQLPSFGRPPRRS
ncbi:MAG: hypothetical protein ACHWZW_21070 [Spirulina sp.]